ncbi:hypothetical protein LRK24_05150 [Rhodanobacter denitrificans]|uniref:DUF2846 domain-containing protein n=1 Tax=Rhodanobacter denitrificans TaxID=666685 RepID=M4NKS0_9GAMM|nr:MULTISPECIES: hypothetical protein [Rhodanobacter]AGG90283.1 hypothetical protein R2APBS1_3213 [Rhodanobacter denitrificans]UJJ57443.1 hypothetical protein LRK55_12250 [Rhodanobacter denitrificans]UJM85670.1 hypothetical protein LRJ86_12890 [Rhodanobacter denitrificans]UJM91305.1 hypothetical protein LRK24_05150 [Rhodanobacter denitrificans]
MKKLLWMLLVVLTACSADVRRFVPPAANLNYMAHLIALSDSAGTLLRSEGHYLFITSVDGAQSKSNWELRKLPSDIYLTPGAHRFGVLYQHSGLTASAQFEVDAKEGMAYYIHRHAGAYGVQFWLTEGKEDGPKVGRLLQAPE